MAVGQIGQEEDGKCHAEIHAGFKVPLRKEKAPSDGVRGQGESHI